MVLCFFWFPTYWDTDGFNYRGCCVKYNHNRSVMVNYILSVTNCTIYLALYTSFTSGYYCCHCVSSICGHSLACFRIFGTNMVFNIKYIWRSKQFNKLGCTWQILGLNHSAASIIMLYNLMCWHKLFATQCISCIWINEQLPEDLITYISIDI